MADKRWIIVVLLLTIILGVSWWNSYAKPATRRNEKTTHIPGLADYANLAIVYDNNPYDPRLKKAWGFSCFIDLQKIKILFDTGGDPGILLENMAKLNIDVHEIQIVVLSHIHGDHVGGLSGILEENRDLRVYVPSSFPRSFKDEIDAYGCEIIEVGDAAEICQGVMTTGELGAGIKEQSLIIKTTKGTVVITGCAHPDVVNIVKEAKKLTGEKIFFILGGFHLIGKNEKEISLVIKKLKEIGVENVAPCHCSGERARSMFKESFGKNYIEAGVGKKIEINERFNKG